MLAAAVSNHAFDTNTDKVVVSETTVIEEVTEQLDENFDNQNIETKTTKEKVEEYFADIPVLIDVAYCESRFSQFNSDGSVKRGMVNPADVGVMQINEKYHLETAQKLGLNIHTLEGNMAYGRYLYEREGTTPWKYSSGCWNQTREVALNR